jgi:hypothetical protein
VLAVLSVLSEEEGVIVWLSFDFRNKDRRRKAGDGK